MSRMEHPKRPMVHRAFTLNWPMKASASAASVSNAS